MKLYLSSYEWGNATDQLTRMVGANRKVAVITNAGDQFPEEGTISRLEDDKGTWRKLNLEPERLDLRNYFGKTDELGEYLNEFGLIWAKGGNAFVLRRAMAQSGFDGVIKNLLQESNIVYGGFSAGVCVVTPTLHGIELVDDKDIVPKGYSPAVTWDGLGLVEYSIAPHYKSDHPESAAVDNVVAYFEQQRMPYRALYDGEVIVVDA